MQCDKLSLQCRMTMPENITVRDKDNKIKIKFFIKEIQNLSDAKPGHKTHTPDPKSGHSQRYLLLYIFVRL